MAGIPTVLRETCFRIDGLEYLDKISLTDVYERLKHTAIQ
jgi:hypothetical protein